MPLTAVNGVEISYTDSGGRGPAVVFSHGFLMDRTMFDQQVTALAAQYRVITWDQRGHGGTRATGAFIPEGAGRCQAGLTCSFAFAAAACRHGELTPRAPFPRRCLFRASGRPGQGPGAARPRQRRRRRP